MKASIESTTEIVEMFDVNHRPFTARVWQGVTEGGVEFTLYSPCVQVLSKNDNSEFERELLEHVPPTELTRRAIDMRFVI